MAKGSQRCDGQTDGTREEAGSKESKGEAREIQRVQARKNQMVDLGDRVSHRIVSWKWALIRL